MFQSRNEAEIIKRIIADKRFHDWPENAAGQAGYRRHAGRVTTAVPLCGPNSGMPARTAVSIPPRGGIRPATDIEPAGRAAVALAP